GLSREHLYCNTAVGCLLDGLGPGFENFGMYPGIGRPEVGVAQCDFCSMNRTSSCSGQSGSRNRTNCSVFEFHVVSVGSAYNRPAQGHAQDAALVTTHYTRLATETRGCSSE